MSAQKKVLVFGTFDGLHEGHRFFLREARKRGNRLIAVVAPNAIVRELKGRAPRAPLEVRRAAILAERLADEVVAGDEKRSSWKIIAERKPDTICVGYDQTELATALDTLIQKENLSITLVHLPARRPRTHHSSLLP